MSVSYGGELTIRLRQLPGKGGWTFAPVPDECAPRATHGWGRTPVRVAIRFSVL